jgi:hypothetical protein
MRLLFQRQLIWWCCFWKAANARVTTGEGKTLRLSGFALISVSDYNIDKCEENPGTYQTVSDEAVFSKTRFRQLSGGMQEMPISRGGFSSAFLRILYMAS